MFVRLLCLSLYVGLLCVSLCFPQSEHPADFQPRLARVNDFLECIQAFDRDAEATGAGAVPEEGAHSSPDASTPRSSPLCTRTPTLCSDGICTRCWEPHFHPQTHAPPSPHTRTYTHQVLMLAPSMSLQDWLMLTDCLPLPSSGPVPSCCGY